MTVFSTHYETLGVPDNASAEEIKSAFRKLALVMHPDKNGNSPESQANFIVLYNAYSVLSDTEKKKEYDAYLATSAVLKESLRVKIKPSVKKTKDSAPVTELKAGSLEAVLSQVNFILWEIEDFMRAHHTADWKRVYSGKTLSQHLLHILVFLDQWVLSAAGFRDYFPEARKQGVAEGKEYFGRIRETLGNPGEGWNAYTGVRDYFYNIRKRADRFLGRVRVSDLVRTVPGTDARIIDNLFEAQSLALHYIYSLNRVLAGESDFVPRFRYSRDCYKIQ